MSSVYDLTDLPTLGCINCDAKDAEIVRLKKLIPLAFKHGVETACDFYDNGMPKRIGDQAYAKWVAENGI